MGEKKGNNEDEMKNNNGGDGVHIRLLINNKERFEGRFEGSFEGVKYMKVDCVDNKLRVKVDLGKPREKKKVDGKPQKKADEKKPKDKEKKGNNEDEKKKNNGGDGIHIRLLINNKERFEGRFEGSFEGVEYMKVDCVDNKLRVKVDLGKPQEKKKVDGKPQKKADEKKSKDKEPPVTTAVIQLDCLGCIDKSKKIITETKGYHDMSIDKVKNQITVKGTMNMKALVDALKEKLKKPVEIVSSKKQGGGNKKEKGGGEGGKGKKDGSGVLPNK